MKQRRRIYYTETDKALMWDRWEEGESLNSIARLFDRHHSAIQGILSRTGGIRPPQRTRSQRALTLAQREEISRGVVAGLSLRSIAATLGRAPSTVSREINRNGGRHRYRANSADQAAWDRAHRPQTVSCDDADVGLWPFCACDYIVFPAISVAGYRSCPGLVDTSQRIIAHILRCPPNRGRISPRSFRRRSNVRLYALRSSGGLLD